MRVGSAFEKGIEDIEAVRGWTLKSGKRTNPGVIIMYIILTEPSYATQGVSFM